MFEVCFLRHPAVEYPPGVCYGRLEVPLAPGWQSWAEARAATLAATMGDRGACIWSSPSQRCAQVASLLAARLRRRLRLDTRLLELDFGEWEGQAWDAIGADALDRWADDPAGFCPPGGEAGAALVGRCTSFIAALAGESRSCIVISHGGPLRLLPPLLRGEPPDLLAPAPAIGSLIRVRPDR